MPEFTSHDPGTPCWVDLMSPDIDASKAFYTSVFGWDAVDEFDPEGSRIYVSFKLDDKTVAGLGGQPPGMENMPPMWNTYIATEDCEATAAKVTEAGGAVIMPPMQVMEAGSMAIFADPTGAAFSAWQAGDHYGAQVGNEPNTYSWNELMSRQLDSAKAFYSQVFGWEYDVQDMGPMGEYNVIAGGAENQGLGGLMAMPPDVPEEVPNHWAVYFMVADINDTVAKVEAGGGQVVNGPFPIPGVGQTAVVHDPAGGNFQLLQPEG
jgi:predicted enzyme related to lactoylglutathione lyase